MSLNNLTTRALPPHFAPSLAEPAGREDGQPPQTEETGVAAAGAEPFLQQNDKVSQALTILVAYIPTEVVALYLAAVSTLPVIKRGIGSPPETLVWLDVVVYLLFTLVLTPGLFALLYLHKRRQLKQPLLPESWKAWPWWRMLAATLAFAIWGLAIPNTMLGSDLLGPVIGLLALFVSMIFTLLESIFAP